eukprot:48559_1
MRRRIRTKNYQNIVKYVCGVCFVSMMLVYSFIQLRMNVVYVKSNIPEFSKNHTNYYQLYHEFGIHTQIVLKENILFIPEWIEYHKRLGFTSFVFYENTGSYRGGNDAVNKYGIEFDELISANESDINKLQTNIIKSFSDIRITFIKDYDNRFKVKSDSIIDYVQHYHDEVKWTAFIDVDEFIMTKMELESFLHTHSKYQKFIIGQVKFEDRWCNLEKDVTSIENLIFNITTAGWAPKSIIKTNVINVSNIWNIHNIGIYKGNKTLWVNITDIWFNHYNVNKFQIAWMKRFYVQNSFQWCKNHHLTIIKGENFTKINKMNYVDTQIYIRLKEKHCNFISVNNSVSTV